MKLLSPEVVNVVYIVAASVLGRSQSNVCNVRKPVGSQVRQAT